MLFKKATDKKQYAVNDLVDLTIVTITINNLTQQRIMDAGM